MECFSNLRYTDIEIPKTLRRRKIYRTSGEKSELLCKSVIVSHPPSSDQTALQSFLHAALYQSVEFTENEYAMTDHSKILLGEDCELEPLLRLYRSFPGSSNKFKTPFVDPYDTNPYYFTGSNKNVYMYKQDILIELQQSASYTPFNEKENTFIISVVAFFLKAKEQNFRDKCELTKVSAKKLIEFRENLHRELEKMAEKNKEFNGQPMNLISHREIFDKLRKLLPKNEKDINYNSVLKLVKKYEKEVPIKGNEIQHTIILNWIQFLIEKLEGFMTENPSWFQLDPIPRNTEDPIVIRIFDCYNRKVVLKYEALMVDDDKGGHEKMVDVKKLLKKTGHYGTIDYEEFLKDLESIDSEKKKNVEFIEYPMKNDNRRTSFIPTFDGKYCILAADLLMEIFRDMITAQRVFLKIDGSNWPIVPELFDSLKHVFPADETQILFIETEKADLVRDKCTTFFDRRLKNKFGRVYAMPKIEANGFDYRSLEMVIKILGLNTVFPYIDVIGPALFKSFKKGNKKLQKSQKSKNYKLNSTHFWFILELVQLVCLFGNLPNLNPFFHRQTECRILPIILCPLCTGKDEMENENTDNVTELLENTLTL